ncbi:hypothetical protein [Clostridium beijerinckii]|uniref:hypothetical protein n=1 Tax=Clostridium beijerinckii TaxID=1520 RepID=UPI001570AE67|nr:hypothetical protein [Clostridium beijerinckii]NRT69996.1 hypothetical protein [Clostridium beijerinckii]
MDEFIRDYEKNGGVFVDSNISDGNLISIEGMAKSFYLRNYNPRTKTLTFKHISYELQSVIDEIIKLKQKIKQINFTTQ